MSQATHVNATLSVTLVLSCEVRVNPFVHASFRSTTSGDREELIVNFGSLGPDMIPTSTMFSNL